MKSIHSLKFLIHTLKSFVYLIMDMMKLVPQRFGMRFEELSKRLLGHILVVCHDRISSRREMIVVQRKNMKREST